MRRRFSVSILLGLILVGGVWTALHVHPEMPAEAEAKIRATLENEILLLLIEIGLILGLSRVMGILFARIRQPQVIGEMVAGIMLGPSLLGLISVHGVPHAVQQALFPEANIRLLNTLSQIGIIFFLFLVGLELDPKMVRNRGAATITIATCSVALPFAMGIALTVILYRTTSGLFTDPHRRFAASLFMGAAMSITAFPVLARILTERNLQKTKTGAATIAAAAINDVAAWVILAFVIAVAHASGPIAGIRTAALSGVYAAILFLFVRPFLQRLEMIHEREGRLSQNIVAIIFLLVLASAWATEAIGIHAMFGAFLIGCVMPKGSAFVRHLTDKLEDYTVVFLLPIFFAYTGLKTQLGLLGGPQAWLVTVIIIATACAGKFGGTLLPAKLFGMSWRESTAMGVLMNTRGLVELVILTIGLQFGVINDQVFAIMVLMALATTFCTTPLLYLLFPRRLLEAKAAGAKAGFTVLVPVASPASGRRLMRIADLLSGAAEPDRRIIALHLQKPGDRTTYRAALDEPANDPALAPLMNYAEQNKIPVETISAISRDVPADIARISRDRIANLVLIGFHRPVFSRTILGGTVHRVMTGSDADVGVFVDRGIGDLKRVLVPYMGGPHDRLALELANRLARNAGCEVTILHVVPTNRQNDQRRLDAKGIVEKTFAEPGAQEKVKLNVVPSDLPAQTVIDESPKFDLVVIGVSDEWGLSSHLFGWRPEQIANQSSTSLLIVRKHAALPATVAVSDAITAEARTVAPDGI